MAAKLRVTLHKSPFGYTARALAATRDAAADRVEEQPVGGARERKPKSPRTLQDTAHQAA